MKTKNQIENEIKRLRTKQSKPHSRWAEDSIETAIETLEWALGNRNIGPSAYISEVQAERKREMTERLKDYPR
jgi:hypothetical protein